MSRLADVPHRLSVQEIYFNWKSGKSEKCIFCYPRIEAGQPTVCSETCVGRIRYLGVLLYDADRIEQAAAAENEKNLYQSQLDIFLDPNDPAVIAQALKDGVAQSVIDAAQRSPVYKWRWSGSWRCHFTLNTARCQWSGMCHHCHRFSRRWMAGRWRTPACCRMWKACAFRLSIWRTC